MISKKMYVERFTTIKLWMKDKNGLNLHKNELICYAIIFGYCQDENHHEISLSYFSDWLGVNKRGVIRVLNRLKTKGLIDIIPNKGFMSTYRINENKVEDAIARILSIRATHGFLEGDKENEKKLEQRAIDKVKEKLEQETGHIMTESEARKMREFLDSHDWVNGGSANEEI